MQAKIGHGFLNSDKDWRVKQQLTYFFILIHTVVQYILISNIKGSYKSNLITQTGVVSNPKKISGSAIMYLNC